MSSLVTLQCSGSDFSCCLQPSGKGRRLPEVYCIVSRLGCFDLFSKVEMSSQSACSHWTTRSTFDHIPGAPPSLRHVKRPLPWCPQSPTHPASGLLATESFSSGSLTKLQPMWFCFWVTVTVYPSQRVRLNICAAYKCCCCKMVFWGYKCWHTKLNIV